MNSVAETYEHAGVTVEIHYDYHADHANPRECENITTLVCWHPDYVLGDFQIRGSRGAVETVFETARGRTDFRSMTAIRRYITLMLGGRRVTPLYLYDHSGITISAGSPSVWDNPVVRRDEDGRGMGWDTTMVGFAFCTEADISNCCGEGAEYRTDEWLDKAIQSDVAEYDLFLTGQVYGYVVAPDTDDEESCWGYLGDEDVKSEANAVAEQVAETRTERRRVERLYLMAPETTGVK